MEFEKVNLGESRETSYIDVSLPSKEKIRPCIGNSMCQPNKVHHHYMRSCHVRPRLDVKMSTSSSAVEGHAIKSCTRSAVPARIMSSESSVQVKLSETSGCARRLGIT